MSFSKLKAFFRYRRPLLCSNCFRDHGLREQATIIGRNSARICRACKTRGGAKLSETDLSDLAFEFFVSGSRVRTGFGSAPLLQFNEYRYNEEEVDFSPSLTHDVNLITHHLKVGFFYYGPPMWMIGGTEPLEALLDVETRHQAANQIVDAFPCRELNLGEAFYRLRKNPVQPLDIDEFDAPPLHIETAGRLNNDGLNVLYGSQNLHICIHECRSTLADELYVAYLCPKRPLKCLDLTAEIVEPSSNIFESVGFSIATLFRAEEHSYEASHAISKVAFDSGYDGIIYPSYFSQVSDGTIPNIAVFGRPIEASMLAVKCINRVFIEKAYYHSRFGPALTIPEPEDDVDLEQEMLDT